MICSKCGLPQGTHGIDGGTGMCLACRAKHTADMHDDYDAVVAERDELRAKLDQVRSEIGCARGQRTTQFCAEAVEYKRRLDVVVVLCEECDPAMNSYYLISCPCGWKGSSSECDGGESIADSGDWSDIECPACKRQDPPTLHARAVAIAEGRDNG